MKNWLTVLSSSYIAVCSSLISQASLLLGILNPVAAVVWFDRSYFEATSLWVLSFAFVAFVETAMFKLSVPFLANAVRGLVTCFYNGISFVDALILFIVLNWGCLVLSLLSGLFALIKLEDFLSDFLSTISLKFLGSYCFCSVDWISASKT